MSQQAIKTLRDQSLAASLKRVLGGIPTLTLVLKGERAEPRPARDLSASLAECRAIAPAVR